MRVIDMGDFQFASVRRGQRQTGHCCKRKAKTPKRPAKLGSYILIGCLHGLNSPVHEKKAAIYLRIVAS
jgi:hypothetical protein